MRLYEFNFLIAFILLKRERLWMDMVDRKYSFVVTEKLNTHHLRKWNQWNFDNNNSINTPHVKHNNLIITEG